MDGIEFRITKRIGILNTHETGWNKELNIVSWNTGIPKYDVRDWSPDHERMTRGITLFEDEARALASTLADYFAKVDNEENK